MKCDSQASLLAHTFASLCFGHEPKVRVATLGNGADLRPKEKKTRKKKKRGELKLLFCQNLAICPRNNKNNEKRRVSFISTESWQWRPKNDKGKKNKRGSMLSFY
jgi:hypothetical protein